MNKSTTSDSDRTNNQIEASVIIFNWHRYWLEGVEIFDLTLESSINESATTLISMVTHLHPVDFNGWRDTIIEIVPDAIWHRAMPLAPNNARLARLVSQRQQNKMQVAVAA